MSSLWLYLLTSFHAVLIFGSHSVQADFSDSCDNSTHSTSCIYTYEQLYNNLTKSQNSFNIESALYPAKRPSSVRVFVNIYSPNKTKNSEPVTKYTWSISCLYVAFPARVLEILSLGSILVTHRTKTLKLTIPLFCCNVSDNDDERRTSINEMLEGVLAALQDLAISPGIRDPKLNTAECVIEGDDTDIKATGRCPQIRVIIWMSLFFAAACCPLLANFLDEKQKLAWPKAPTRNTPNNSQRNTASNNEGEAVLLNENNENSRESTEHDNLDKEKCDQTAAMTICGLCFVLAVIGTCILLAALVVSSIYIYQHNDSPPDIIIIVVLLFLVAGVVFWLRKCCLVGIEFKYSVILTISAIEISYFSCWLLIGIMINPTWGLTVTLLVSFLCASWAYAVYSCLNVDDYKVQVRFSCACIIFAVIFLVFVIVTAGQSYNGRETADETLKTALLYLIGGLVSWVSWKLKWPASSPEKKLEVLLEKFIKSQTQNPNQPIPETQTDH